MAIPPFGSAPTPDATASVKGKIQLAGDISGSAASPTVTTSNGVAIVTTTGSQTLTNKTLTSPKINQINDSAGIGILQLSAAVTPSNFVGVGSAAGGVAPSIGSISGGDTNVDFNLTTIGTGRIKANGVNVVTISSTDTLTNKTLTAGLVTADPIASLGIASKQYVDNAATSSSIVTGETPTGLVNGSNTLYTLASVYTTNSVEVFRNGVRMTRGTDYTETSPTAKTVTMTTAPNTGDILRVNYTVSATGFSVGTNSTISSEVPTGTINSSNTSFTTARAYIAGSLEVYLDGVHQRRTTDYTETTPGTGVFTMIAAPITGQSITCNYQFNLNPSSNADTVDGIHASSTATANQLMPLDSNAKYPTTLLTNPYKFRVYRTAALSTVATTFTLIPFDTKSFDTGSNVDIVTNKGRFTAPVAGFYQFSAGYEVASSAGFVAIFLYKNGVRMTRGEEKNYTNAAAQAVVVSDFVQLAANDYVEVFYYTTSAVALTPGAAELYFSGYLISAT